MSDDQRLHSLLLGVRDEQRQRIARLELELHALTTARQGESDDDEHDPEGEPLSVRWSMLTGLLASARAEADQADEALARFDDGTYGICAVCQGAIPELQLEVRPFRATCVACAP